MFLKGFTDGIKVEVKAAVEEQKRSWKGFILILLGLAIILALFSLLGYIESSASRDKFNESRTRANAVTSYWILAKAKSTVGSATAYQLVTTYSQGNYHRMDNIMQDQYDQNISETRIYIIHQGTFFCTNSLNRWVCLAEENLTNDNDKLMVRLAGKAATGKDTVDAITSKLVNSGVISFNGGPKKTTILGRTCNEVSYDIQLHRINESDLEYLGSLFVISSLTDKASVTSCLDEESGLTLYIRINAMTPKKSDISVEVETVGIGFGNELPESVFELPD